jgi:hypothetical protein
MGSEWPKAICLVEKELWDTLFEPSLSGNLDTCEQLLTALENITTILNQLTLAFSELQFLNTSPVKIAPRLTNVVTPILPTGLEEDEEEEDEDEDEDGNNNHNDNNNNDEGSGKGHGGEEDNEKGKDEQDILKSLIYLLNQN